MIFLWTTFALKFEIPDNDGYTYFLFCSLVPVLILPYFFPAPLCIPSNVYHRKKKGKDLLFSNLAHPGIILPGTPFLCSDAPDAPYLQ